MASWSNTRQFTYGSIALFFVLLVLSVPVYYTFFDKAETCFDGLKNQDELEVDCGGMCQKACTQEAQDLLVSYERFFETSPKVFSLLASVENPNQGIYTTKARYVFRTYDEDNVLLNERFGTTYIAPNSTFPIMEYDIYLGERTPTKTVLSFINPIDWQRGTWDEPNLTVSNIKVMEETSTPSIEALLNNNEVYEVKNIRVVIVIYDVSNNVIGTSQTVVERISPKESKEISFTWNKAFDSLTSRVDIFPRALPRNLQ
jgi:hypothetical protein